MAYRKSSKGRRRRGGRRGGRSRGRGQRIGTYRMARGGIRL